MIKVAVEVCKRSKKIKIKKSLYDSGSQISLINYRLLKRLNLKRIKSKAIFKSVNGTSFTDSRALIKIKIHKLKGWLNVYVVRNDKFSYDLLLGLDAIRKFKLLQDEELKIFQRVSDREFEPIEAGAEEDAGSVRFVNFNESINTAEFEVDLKHLNEDRKQKILDLIEKHESIFARNKYDIGQVKRHEAKIRLSELRYVAKKPYKTSFPDQKEIEEQIAKLLEHGLIEESSSPFAAPVTLVFKKEDGRRSRLCIDFRELNKIVVPEEQPFPKIDDIIVEAGKAKFYTVVDLNSAFWSIPVRRKDRHKTAFVTQKGHYQWRVLPFGLKISPACFQRILASIIRKHGLQHCCVNYIDDCLIFSDTFEEHVQHIDQLMTAIKEEGFRLKLLKCDFARDSVKYLGHVVSENKVQPINDNLRAIRDFERPKNVRKLRQWLGKINFYHRFIRNSGERLEPLHALLKKNVKFRWSESCEKAFEFVKSCLCAGPILAIFDRGKHSYIYTDASNYGLGAVLKQPDANGVLHPVAYFSKKLSPTQLKQSVIYKECLAIKEAVSFWQYWLIGSAFTVVTDHRPLETLRVKARTDQPLGDLTHYLSQFSFRIVYSPGKLNAEADALSRSPVLEWFEEQEDEVKAVNLITIESIKSDQLQNVEEIARDRRVLSEDGVKFKLLGNRKRIFVSRDFAKTLISRVHDLYGHIGPAHMLEIIRPFYYCRGLDGLVQRFYRRCEVCSKNKSRKSRDIGLLSYLGPATRPFQIVSLDTIGGFAGNRSTKKYLHLLVDHFTRYAYVRTSSTQNAADFISLVRPIVEKNGVELLLADQYTGVNSDKLKQFLADRGVEMLFTGVDCASSNGLNERLNQTLVNRIRCRTGENRRRAWTRIAEQCVKEYNMTTHSVTKFSPEYLLTGKKSEIVPLSLRRESDLESDRGIALQNSIQNHEKNKKRVDERRVEHEFKVGDLVLVHNGSKLNRSKLDELRSGPFSVIRRVSNSIYEIGSGKRKKEGNLYHISKLRPYLAGL